MWIDEFYELFYSKDSDKIEKAYELKDEKMPDHLYKYKSIDEKGHTFDLLENDLIFLSNANNLNDLYEGEYFYDDNELFLNLLENKILPQFIKEAELTKNEKYALTNSKTPIIELQKLIYDTDPTVNKNLPFTEFSKSSLESTLEVLKKFLTKANDNVKENTYLTCFSKENNLILMWSYYTDSNKGICIKYDLKNDKHFIKRSSYPITYTNNYEYTKELSDIKENTLKLIFDPFLKKEEIWEHENEWRILFNHPLLLRSTIQVGEMYFLKLPRPTAIYLGKRISDENKEKIIEICKKREISLYQMEKDFYRANLNETNILTYSEKQWWDKSFITESIRNKTCKYLIKKYFNYSKSIKETDDNFMRIIESLNDLSNEDIEFFLNQLLFKKEIFPVLYPYYYNVLLFLIKLYDEKSFNNIKTSDGLTIEENLKEWLGHSFSNFYDKQIVRYMIFFERLFMRFYNRYVILNDVEKEVYDKKLQKFKLNNKYVTLVEEDAFEEFMYMHPFTTENRTELIRDNILDNLQTILDLFYKDAHFDEKSCYKEYFHLKSIVKQIENESEIWYGEIFKNSKNYLPIIYSCLFNEYCNIQLQSAGSVLMKNKHIFKLLTNEDKKLFEVLGRINNTKRIASFINECCDELELNYKQNVQENVIREYFNPKNNPYKLIN